MSTNSVHRTVGGATHEQLIADEKDSTATSDAVLDVVTSLRNATPLAK